MDSGEARLAHHLAVRPDGTAGCVRGGAGDMSSFDEWHDQAMREYSEVLNSDSYGLELAYKTGNESGYGSGFNEGREIGKMEGMEAAAVKVETMKFYPDIEDKLKYLPCNMSEVAKAIRDAINA